VSPLVAVALLAFGLVYTTDALRIFWSDMPRRDFGAFYFSGQAWNAGRSIYDAGRSDLPNLNPPSAIAVLFAPLAEVPLRAAGALWQLLGAAALGVSAWRIARALSLPMHAGLAAAGIGLLSVAARYVWLEGQITWLLLVPATEAWLAYRSRSPVVAGVWLGVIIAIKPFFALAALALGVRTTLGAGVLSAGLTVLSLPFTSLTPWQEWLALGPRISITWPLSGSVWTLGARAEGAAPMDVVFWTTLSPLTLSAIAAAALLGAVAAVRQRDPDARWTSAIAVALLLSPLGWIYYLPFAAGALVALWSTSRWSPWLTAAIFTCCLPMNVLFQAIAAGRWAAVSLGAAYTWALLTIVFGLWYHDAPRGVRR
jgi:hypothetical protein